MANSCLNLLHPVACNSPSSSVHGISQARIQEWVAISFSRASSHPRDGIWVPYIGRGVLYHWATGEAPSWVWGAYKWRGRIVTREEGVCKSSFMIFIPAPFSPGEEGFLSLFSLDQKCHGISAWWALLTCKANLTAKLLQSCPTLGLYGL